MDALSVLCGVMILGWGAYVVFFYTIGLRNLKLNALNEWQQAGYNVRCDPAVVQCYSVLPPYADRRQGLGVFGVAEDYLLFRSKRGQTVVIPLADVHMIAVGNMWRRMIGSGKYGPHLIVDYDMPAGRETLAFHSRANVRLGNEIERHSQFVYCPIPRGFRVWNGRLIRPRR